MNIRQKEEIRILRGKGLSYLYIANKLGISQNTIKSFCRRNDLGQDASKVPMPIGNHCCRNCGSELIRIPGKKQKLFCSNKCRMTWWNAHPESVNRKAVREFICATCSRTFKGYGKRARKYCCISCFRAAQAVQK